MKRGQMATGERRGGKFITFEGLDGCGKSTQLENLAVTLRADGIEVVTAREPGEPRLANAFGQCC